MRKNKLSMQGKMIYSCCLIPASVHAQHISLPQVFADAEKQTKVMLKEIPAAKGTKTDLVSPRTLEKGELRLVPAKDWTSGFFPGELWFLYEYTGKPEWKSEAQAYTAI